jgi:hypothetical protein
LCLELPLGAFLSGEDDLGCHDFVFHVKKKREISHENCVKGDSIVVPSPQLATSLCASRLSSGSVLFDFPKTQGDSI